MFGVVGEPTTFQVHSKDKFGNRVSQGGAQVRVRVAATQPNGKDAILELGSGSFQSEDGRPPVISQSPSPSESSVVAAMAEQAGNLALPDVLGTGAVHDLGNGEYSISYVFPLFSNFSRTLNGARPRSSKLLLSLGTSPL